MQLEDAGTLVPQVLAEKKKSLGSAPVMVMLLKLMAELPLLVSVAVFAPPVLPKATLPQVSEEGDAVVVDPEDELAPEPESATLSGVALLLLVMLQVAVSLATSVGVNAIEAVQAVDAARLVLQVVYVTVKSLAFAPVIDAVLRVTELEVVLETVMVCEALLDPILTLPKDKLEGAAVTLPAPVPETETC